MELARERQPNPALEERVVSALVAARLVRRRRPRPRGVYWLAAAAVVVLALALPWWRSRPSAPRGNTYVLMLYNDSGYDWPPPGHMGQRRAEYARWADSLAKLGELDSGGRLEDETQPDRIDVIEPGGLFIIRAPSETEAERIAASSPHGKYRGRIVVRRLIE
jgi:hypothetical protein